METPYERKMRANELRKSGKYEEALAHYSDLNLESPDQYTCAGKLHCLRKLKKFEEAIQLANTLVGKIPDSDWVTTEIIWTYIEGIFYQLPEEESLSTAVSIANKILQHHPNQLASNIVHMKICKIAKNEKNWKVVHEWIQKVDPQSLDIKPKQLPDGREGWSQQGLWYLYRISAIVENGESATAFPFLEYALEHFPKQKKLFLRLRARANNAIGKIEEAIADYKTLCNVRHPDWWILKEYADILSSLNRNDEALDLMYLAAQDRQDPGMMVGLFESIGDLLQAQGDKEQAVLHYQITKLIREERGWKIPDQLNERITGIDISGISIPKTIDECFCECKKVWVSNTGKLPASHTRQTGSNQNVKRGVQGKISLGRPDQPFCFINLDDGDSVICYKDILPNGIKHGDYVILDAIPNWDKKKNRQGWKAQNVRLKNG